jgi:lipoyl(octanoyl) transferase
MSERVLVQIVDLGLIEYRRALTLQQEALARVLDGAPPVLFLLEHPAVITLGRQANGDNLLVSPEELRRRGIALIKTTRGGDVTCHYPGQLVVYPIFRLDQRGGGVRRFFRELEEVVIQVLCRCGIVGQRMEGLTGVYVDGRKIGSMGIGVRRWVSYHGLSLNVSVDLSLFSLMHPCGLKGIEPTAIHLELGRATPKLEEVKEITADAFRDTFAPA